MAAILGTGTQVSGKKSRLSVNGTFLKKNRFSVTYRGDDLDTTNFESTNNNVYGYDEGIIGVIGVDYSAGGDWDAANVPTNAPGIYPREDLQSVNMYPDGRDEAATLWSLAYSRVISATNSTEIRGKVTFEWSGKSQGVFTIPA